MTNYMGDKDWWKADQFKHKGFHIGKGKHQAKINMLSDCLFVIIRTYLDLIYLLVANHNPLKSRSRKTILGCLSFLLTIK